MAKQLFPFLILICWITSSGCNMKLVEEIDIL